MLEDEKWSCYFRDFVFPYGFYGPEEYREWLKNAGFRVKRLEMNSKDMALAGKESLFASIASTWHPFTQQVPESLKINLRSLLIFYKFIDELVNLFVSFRPPDNKGHIHVQMIRLEIEAYAEK